MYRKNFLTLISTSFFIFFNFVTIFSQKFDTKLNLSDTTQVHIIRLKNGKKIKGRITSIENEKVFFSPKKNRPDTVLTFSQIKNIGVVGNIAWNSKKYDSNLDYVNYLFFVNTAFRLKKGARMYRTFMGASLIGERAFDDGFSMGLNFSFPLFISANLKIGGTLGSSKKSNLAFKSTLLLLPVGEGFSIFENSLIYTFGTPDRFLNFALTNYSTRQNEFFFEYFPRIYHSFSLGGGIRMNEHWQLILENHINFNNVFVDAKLLPSLGLSYTTSKFNFAFGFNSANQRGFNLFPIMDFSQDDITTFERSLFSRFPYFSIAKIF